MGDLKKILLVEDDAISRKLISIYLKGICEMLAAADLQEGREMINKYDFSLIITDMNLGSNVDNSDGVQLMQYAKAKVSMLNVPVIGITAYFMTAEELDELSRMGFDSFMSKPILKTEFIAQVKKYLLCPVG